MEFELFYHGDAYLYPSKAIEHSEVVNDKIAGTFFKIKISTPKALKLRKINNICQLSLTYSSVKANVFDFGIMT